MLHMTHNPHQDFGGRAQRLLFFGYNADVEDSGEDEDETRGRCSTWKQHQKNRVICWKTARKRNRQWWWVLVPNQR